jgi:hypothetical protein
MNKTVISHFFNEQYLLPWWLNHHKEKFDHGIMIDYNSTDESVNIIKSICPSWKIVKTRNAFFEARPIDEEVEDIEKSIDGWRICLNTTEFLLGDMSILENTKKDSYKIPSMVMVDDNPNISPNPNVSLIKQKTHGIHFDRSFHIRRARNLHQDNNIIYPIGRHYENYDTNDFVILWYGWSPYNHEQKQRKLQIKNNIPESDRIKGLGTGHFLQETEMDNVYKNEYLPLSRDLTESLKQFKGD